MKSILEHLYYGNISPWEDILPKDPEYRPSRKKVCDLEEHLFQKLPPEEAENFTEYQGLIQKIYCMETYEGFSYGFRLGMNLLWEVVSADL